MILSWKDLAQKIYDDIKNEVKKFEKKPKLWVVLVWQNESSLRYIKQKQKWAEYVWFDFELYLFDNEISENNLLLQIEKLNNDNNISWYIVQLPLPKHIDKNKIINKIHPDKDVDWFHPLNQWKIVVWDKTWFLPCTPAWILGLLDYYNIEIVWRNIVILWRSNIVWKPLLNMLVNEWATLTICNSKTKNIEFFTKNADIVILATWQRGLLKSHMIKKDAVVIDVWFSVFEGKIYWDACFDEILLNWNKITPVPWWVWPLTVAFLMKNTLFAYKKSLWYLL